MAPRPWLRSAAGIGRPNRPGGIDRGARGLWWLASFYPPMTIMGQRHHDHDEAHTVTWGMLAEQSPAPRPKAWRC
jgi:hypothetical protein